MHILSLFYRKLAPFSSPYSAKRQKQGWIQESTWHIMSLVQAWRKVRSADRAWWNKVILRILWQGWSSWLVVYMDRDALLQKLLASSRSCTADWLSLSELSTSFMTIKINLSVMIAVKPPMQSWLMLLSGQKGVMIKASMRNCLSFALGKLALFLCLKNGWLPCADAGGDCIQMGRARFL